LTKTYTRDVGGQPWKAALSSNPSPLLDHQERIHVTVVCIRRIGYEKKTWRSNPIRVDNLLIMAESPQSSRMPIVEVARALNALEAVDVQARSP
jgi:hypothetical protein